MSIFGPDEQQQPLFGEQPLYPDPAREARREQMPAPVAQFDEADQLLGQEDKQVTANMAVAEDPAQVPQTEPTEKLVLYNDPVFGEVEVPESIAKEQEAYYAKMGEFTPNEETGEVEWGDYASQTLAGGGSVVQALGWGIEQLGFDDAGQVVQYFGKNAVDYWNDKLSDPARAELAKEFIKVNEDGSYSFGDASWRTAALLGAGSLLGTAAGGGVGAGITRVLQIFANPAGRGVLAAAVKAGSGAAEGSKAAIEATEAVRKLKVIDGILGAAGFGAGEGAIGGTMAGASVKDQAMLLPQEVIERNPKYQSSYVATENMGMTEDERKLYARDQVSDEAAWRAGSKAFVTTALLGAPMGAFFGKLMGSRAMNAIDSKVLPRIAAGGAGEAAQEFAQGGLEQIITNQSLMSLDDRKTDVYEGALNAAVGGAVAGAPLGAAFAAPGNAADSSPDNVVGGPKEAVAAALARGVPQADIDAVMVQKTSPILKLRAVRGLVPRETTPPAEPKPSIGESENLGDISVTAGEEGEEDAPSDPVTAAENALKDAIGKYGESPKRAVAQKEVEGLREKLSAARDVAEGKVAPPKEGSVEAGRSPEVEFREAKKSLAAAVRVYGDRPAADRSQTRLKSLEQRAEQAQANVDAANATSVEGEDSRQRFGRVEKERHAFKAAEAAYQSLESLPAQGVTAEREAKLSELRANVDTAKFKYEETRVKEGVPELSAEDQVIADAANMAATSPTNDLQLPTKKQRESGRYRKGKVQAYGLEIEIESPAGSIREGDDEDGKPYRNTMQGHYGYIKTASGADGEPLDVMIGAQIGGNSKAEYVYVVDQTDAYGDFDEHKVLMGYGSRNEAEDAYVGSYEKGWDRYSEVTQMTKREFKAWVAAGDKTKPVGEVLYSRKKKLLDAPDGGGIRNSEAALGTKTVREKKSKDQLAMEKSAREREKKALARKMDRARKSESADQEIAIRMSSKNNIDTELHEALVSAGKAAVRVEKDGKGKVISSTPDPAPASMVIAQAASDMATASKRKGWIPLSGIKSVGWSGDKVAIEWKTQRWEFALDADGKVNKKTEGIRAKRMANKLVAEIRNVQKRAEDGDERARVIMRAAHWYSNMTYYLRQSFGAATDLVADILGATSPQTPVSTNYKNTIDVLKQLSKGELTGPIRRFKAHMDAGGKISAYMKDKTNESHLIVHSITGKKYGINSPHVLKALAGFLRAEKKGDSAKMSSFAANLAGAGQLATIDVWAARALQRLWSNGKRRIHPRVQENVSGKLLKNDIKSVDGDYRFGAKVFDQAAESLGMEPHELQAVAWFLEKEIWTDGRWTTAEGEGGSFEQQIGEHDLRRIVVGMSAQLGDMPPPDALVKETEGLLNRMAEQSHAVAWRVQNSQGVYDSEEQAWDMELTADKNFNYMIFARRLAAVAKRNVQDSFLIARTLDAGEVHPNGRPGLEIYFNPLADVKEAFQHVNDFLELPAKWGKKHSGDKIFADLNNVLSVMDDPDADVKMGGYTFIVSPSAAYLDGSGAGDYIGMRILFIPELRARFDDTYADRVAGNPAAAEADFVAAESRLLAAARVVSEMDTVHQVYFGNWDVSTITREHYDEVRKGSVTGRGPTARGEWEPVSRSIALQDAAEANRRSRGQGEQRFVPEGITGSDESTLNFSRSLIARSTEVSPEIPSGQWRTSVEEFLSKAIGSVREAVRVRVVRSTKDIPFSVPGDVEGMYHKGTNTVYIVSANLPSMQRAGEVFLHEVFGHSTMEMIVPEFESVLTALSLQIERGEFGAYANRVLMSEGGAVSPRRMAKEVIAQMAESGLDIPIMREAIAVVRALLRRMGLKLKLTEGDIRLLIAKAARLATNGQAVQLPVTSAVEMLQRWTGALLGDGDLSYEQINALTDDPEQGRFIARMPVADINTLAGYEALKNGVAHGDPKAVHIWLAGNAVTAVAGGGEISAMQRSATVVFHTEGKAPGGILKGPKEGAVAAPAVMTKIDAKKLEEIVARYGPASGQDVYVEQSAEETTFFQGVAQDEAAYEEMLDAVPGAYISPLGEFMVPRGSSTRASEYLDRLTARGEGAASMRNGSYTQKLLKEAEYVEKDSAFLKSTVGFVRERVGDDAFHLASHEFLMNKVEAKGWMNDEPVQTVKLIAQLKKGQGIKAEELKLLGILDWLEAGKLVTRSQTDSFYGQIYKTDVLNRDSDIDENLAASDPNQLNDLEDLSNYDVVDYDGGDDQDEQELTDERMEQHRYSHLSDEAFEGEVGLSRDEYREHVLEDVRQELARQYYEDEPEYEIKVVVRDADGARMNVRVRGNEAYGYQITGDIGDSPLFTVQAVNVSDVKDVLQQQEVMQSFFGNQVGGNTRHGEHFASETENFIEETRLWAAPEFLKRRYGETSITKRLYGHWNEPNVVVNTITSERNSPDGPPSFHILELQSDLHQNAAGYLAPGDLQSPGLLRDAESVSNETKGRLTTKLTSFLAAHGMKTDDAGVSEALAVSLLRTKAFQKHYLSEYLPSDSEDPVVNREIKGKITLRADYHALAGVALGTGIDKTTTTTRFDGFSRHIVNPERQTLSSTRVTIDYAAMAMATGIKNHNTVLGLHMKKVLTDKYDADPVYDAEGAPINIHMMGIDVRVSFAADGTDQAQITLQVFNNLIKRSDDEVQQLILEKLFAGLQEELSAHDTKVAALTKALNSRNGADVIAEYLALNSANQAFNTILEKHLAQNEGVPEVPGMNNTWMAIGFKHAMFDAVSKGYGSISWGDADASVARWSELYRKLYTHVYNDQLPSIAKKMGLTVEHRNPSGMPSKGHYHALIPVDLAEKIKEYGLPLFSRRSPAQQEPGAETGEVLYSRRAKMSAGYEAIADRVMDKPMEDMTLMDRLARLKQRFSLWDKGAIKQGILNSGYSIERMERDLTGGGLLDASDSAYKAYVATKSIPSVMASIFANGVPELKDGILQIVPGQKGMQAIFDQLRDPSGNSLLHAWEVYAAARRADRLIKETNPDGTSRENNFTQNEIDTIIREGRTIKAPDGSSLFEKVFDEWQTFNNSMLDLAVSTGSMDADMRDKWRTNDYVPFYRAMELAKSATLDGTANDGSGMSGGSGLSNQNVRSMRLHGSDKKIAGTVFENMVMNTAYIVDTIMKHNAMERIVDLGDGAVMHKMPMGWKPIQMSGDQLARAMLAGGLINAPPNDPNPATYALDVVKRMTPAQRASWQTMFQPAAPKGPSVVSVMRNGKMEYFEVIDPLLLRSINAIGTRSFDGLAWAIFRKPKHWLTTLVTADPAFMLANFARDTLSAFVTSNAGIIPGFDSVKGFKAAITGDPIVMQIMMAGSGGGGFYEKSEIDLRKLIAAKKPKGGVERFVRSIIKTDNENGIWKMWMKIGSASENANRIAIARAVMDRGGTLAEAAYQAQDIMNFSMRGDYAAMQALIETIPFLNARVQGLYRLARGAKENPGAFTLKGMLIMAATLALLAKNEDDERYKELEEWDRDTYWHFFLGDDEGGHYRLPKPFEVGLIFATIPERLVNALSGDEQWSLFRERFLAGITETLSFNPIPQVLKPATEDFFNFSMFTRRPIIGMSLDGLPPEEQYESYTGATVREFASAMPDFAPEWLRSPKRLETLFRGYFGSLGMYVLSAADGLTRGAANYPERPAMRWQELPVVTRFARPEIAVSTKYQEMLYTMSEEANDIARAVKRTAEVGMTERSAELKQENLPKLQVRKAVNQIREDVSKINTKIRLVTHNRDMSGEEKKERIERLTKAKNETLRKVERYAWAF